MIIKLKWVVLFQGIVILILLGIIIDYYHSDVKTQNKIDTGLLSPRVYTGLLESKSLLIVNFAPLKEKIQNYIAKNKLNASVYVENFRNGAFMGINEKQGFFPASLNKLPVAILIMKKVEEKDFSMDTMLEIKESDRTNSSGELYRTNQKQLPLKLVLEKLLKESDNTALRILLRQVDLGDLQFILDYYGIDINVDSQKQEVGNSDLITPKAMSTLFSSLYFSTVLEADDSEYLLQLLKQSEFPINQVADLPDNVIVAQKYGENYYSNKKYFHDCGIMYIDDTRIFYCIMTRGIDEENAVGTIGVITNQIYHYVQDTKSKLKAYRQ